MVFIVPMVCYGIVFQYGHTRSTLDILRTSVKMPGPVRTGLPSAMSSTAEPVPGESALRDVMQALVRAQATYMLARIGLC
jgi:hypothetical protein